MTYNKKGIVISVDKIEGLGKNPGLWIGWEIPNQLIKVASFGNEKKADAFCKGFEYMLGVGERKEVRWND